MKEWWLIKTSSNQMRLASAGPPLTMRCEVYTRISNAQTKSDKPAGRKDDRRAKVKTTHHTRLVQHHFVDWQTGFFQRCT